MRRRLVVLLALLMGFVLAALSVAFGRSYAATRQQEMFVDRLQDTSQFADIAQQATTAAALDALRDYLDRYSDLYGITVAVVSPAGTTWALAGRLGDLTRQETTQEFAEAAAGHQSAAPATLWPWQDGVLVVAVPVLRGDTVAAVAITVSSSARLRATLGRDLALIVVIDLAVMVLLVALAMRLADWVLRPVFVLDAAARAISTGDRSVRVGGLSGPVELRRLSNTFNGMAAAVDLAMQRQEEFVADASHQLRNPLVALVLRLDALAIGLDGPRADQVRLAREECSRLEAILDELLELATTVHVAARPRPVDLAELVDVRVPAWRPMADRREVHLFQSISSTPAVWGLVDPVLISSALDAVLDNAVKFTPTSGRVAVRVGEDPDAATVEVTDSGPGLGTEDLTHIGDRFWRSAASQNIPGSGLGLSIAQTLLRATGAEIAFSAATPHGLCVRIRMPRAEPGRDEGPLESAPGVSAAGAP
ncbi:MAG TPA: HAMP domain-containing sensor histidine kinase [Micromonosporaceae bacterium]|jgi:signal transduction histidine kinase